MPKKESSDNERFEFTDDNDLTTKREKLRNPNILRVRFKMWKSAREISNCKNMNADYWLLDEPELNKLMSKFWFEVRTQEGKKYTVSSLAHLHYGIKAARSN